MTALVDELALQKLRSVKREHDQQPKTIESPIPPIRYARGCWTGRGAEQHNRGGEKPGVERGDDRQDEDLVTSVGDIHAQWCAFPAETQSGRDDGSTSADERRAAPRGAAPASQTQT